MWFWHLSFSENHNFLQKTECSNSSRSALVVSSALYVLGKNKKIKKLKCQECAF